MADGPEPAQATFPVGGGATGALVRALDWSPTPLGAIDGWPPALRSVVNLVLGSPLSMVALWGPDLVQVYNDGYAVICGSRHPWALGRPTRECWPELWAFNALIYEAVLGGETRAFAEQLLVVERHGHGEDAWFDLTYSPLRDEGGQVAGVLVTMAETTHRVLANRRLASEHRRQARMFEQAPGFIAMLRGPEHVFEFANAAYRRLVSHRDVVGLPLREALPDIKGQGFVELLDRVVATGEPYVGRAVPISLQASPSAPVEDRFLDFIYQPVMEASGAVAGIFVEGSDVTDRVRMEAELRESEGRYRQIVEGAEDFAILALDEAGTIVEWNSGAERILGWTREEAVGQSGRLIFTPEDAAEGIPDREMARAQSDGRAVDERWHLRRDGSRFWGSGLMMHRDGGGFLKLFRDRTAEHEAEAALRLSEARYRTLFEAIDAGFCIIEMIWDEAGRPVDYRFLEANPAFERQAGFAHVAGRRMREVVPDHEPFWFDLYGRVARTGEPAQVEQGSAALGRWWDVRAFRVGEPGEGRVAVLFNDVTERRGAELRLRELNETLERRVAEALAERKVLADMVEGTDAFVQVAGLDYRWLAINKAAADEFERIFGVRPKVGDSMLDLLGDKPEHREAVRAVWGRALAGEEFTQVGEFGDPGLARRFYEMKFGVLRDPGGAQVGAYQFVSDVTQRVEEQRRLAEAEEALRQSQKMEAVGQLTGGLAHDFNNLLAGIAGSLELMGTRIAQGRVAEVDRYLVAAQEAARRAAALTHRLLAFSRRQTLAPKPTDVRALVAGLEELIGRTVGPQVEVECVRGEGVWTVEVDPNQLENALLNLCINARDAMPGGGRITVEIANRSLDGPAARERDLPPGEYVTLHVSDTGTGMAPEVAARAFDPFFTTKPLGEGTGLGLSMVYGFARQSGGQVRIHSAPGRGTTVSLYLPRHLGEAEVKAEMGEAASIAAPAEAASEAAPAASAARGKTVLVIDDEPLVRMLVVDALTELGYAALEASNGPEGLRILRSKARVDLLVTDVGLPGGLNGRQVADAARVSRPGLAVLFITGYAEAAVLSHGHLDPGMQVITKPFGVHEIGQRIQAVLSQG